jgi:hypothetical protein
MRLAKPEEGVRMGRVKTTTHEMMKEVNNLSVKVETVNQYYQYTQVPIFIKNPEIQETVPLILPPEKMEKYRQKLEDFLTVMDTQIRADIDKNAKKCLADLLKRVPDYPIQEYSIPDNGEDAGEETEQV